MIRRLAAAAAIVAVLLTACSSLGIGNSPRQPVPYPGGCASFDLSQRRCDYIVAWARMQVRGAEQATAVELAPDPGVDCPAGQLCVRSGSVPLVVRFHLADGSAVDQLIHCGVGTGNTLLCSEKPETRVSSPTMNGYRDFPEGATAVPDVDPAAKADAESLEIERQVIRIDHRGAFEIVLGDAVLPNGILHEATFGLADPGTMTVSTTPDGIWLAVESKLPDRPPFFNIYEHGWWPGVEPVRAILRFEVVLFDPGTTLEVVNNRRSVASAGGRPGRVSQRFEGGVPKLSMERAGVGYLGLDADAHNAEMHGGPNQAVCLYSAEAIERVAADGHTAFAGSYGENLTIEGVDWAALREGDRFAFGDDGLELELTYHAAPCSKLAHYFTEEGSLASRPASIPRTRAGTRGSSPRGTSSRAIGSRFRGRASPRAS